MRAEEGQDLLSTAQEPRLWLRFDSQPVGGTGIAEASERGSRSKGAPDGFLKVIVDLNVAGSVGARLDDADAETDAR